MKKFLTKVLSVLLAVCMLAGIPAVRSEAAAGDRGVDVSKWQGPVDWNAVAQSGVSFAFIKVGSLKSGIDEYFYYNMLAAQAAGIKTGVYIYSYATSVEEAAVEAQFVLNAIQNVQVSYPVVWDVEDKVQKQLSPETLSMMANTFCAIIEAEGYYPMVYANKTWFTTKIGAVFYDKWVAQWADRCDIPDAAVWQYSSTGAVPGISGSADMNIALKDFSTSIVQNGWVARKGFFHYYIDYKMQRGWLDLGTARYYLDAAGRMVTGWLLLDTGIYFMQPDGIMSVGFTPIGQGMYYFDANGNMQTGLQNIGGLSFFFAPEGPMYTGFFAFPDGTRFFAADGHMVTGFNLIGDYYHYFNENGLMQIGWQTLGGQRYYFDAAGVMQTGLQIVDGKTYLFDAAGVMQTGLQAIGGKLYLFDADGHMVTGAYQMNGLSYLFAADGSMYTGWFNDGLTVRYYETDGHMAIGLVTIGDGVYYFDANGNMQTGLVDVAGTPLLFDVDGRLLLP